MQVSHDGLPSSHFTAATPTSPTSTRSRIAIGQNRTHLEGDAKVQKATTFIKGNSPPNSPQSPRLSIGNNRSQPQAGNIASKQKIQNLSNNILLQKASPSHPNNIKGYRRVDAEAAKKLLQGQPNGTYIVRDSSIHGNYAVSYVRDGEIKKSLIVKDQEGLFIFNEQEVNTAGYETIDDLITADAPFLTRPYLETSKAPTTLSNFLKEKNIPLQIASNLVGNKTEMEELAALKKFANEALKGEKNGSYMLVNTSSGISLYYVKDQKVETKFFSNWTADSDIQLQNYITENPDLVKHSEEKPYGYVKTDIDNARKMLEGQKPGSYIVRDSRTPGEYTITYVDNDSKVKHQRILQNEKGFYLNGMETTYSTISALVQNVDLLQKLYKP